MQYSDEALKILQDQIEELKSITVDDKIYVPVSLISRLMNFMFANLQFWGEQGDICDMEAMHTMAMLDFMGKIVVALELKHADVTVPKDLSSLEVDTEE